MDNPSHDTTVNTDFETLALELQDVTALQERWWRLAQDSNNAMLLGLLVQLLALVGTVVTCFTSPRTEDLFWNLLLVNALGLAVCQLFFMYGKHLKKRANALEDDLQKKLTFLEEKTIKALEKLKRKTTSL